LDGVSAVSALIDTGHTRREVTSRGVDALLYLGTEMFIFSGPQFWRKAKNSDVAQGPYIIVDQWPGGPTTLDSAYERPDGSIVFFKGTRHWVFTAFQLQDSYPKKLSSLGLPKSGTLKVEAALNWKRAKRRRKTYFFVGDKYYRYDEEKNRMDRGYPKDMSIWDSAVKTGLDAAVESPNRDRESLLVKGNRVFTLHNYKVKVIEVTTLSEFLGCTQQEVNPAPIIGNAPSSFTSRRRKTKLGRDKKEP